MKLSILDKFLEINTLISNIHENSESRQGYVNISTLNGFKENMWGNVEYRVLMSGAPDGYFDFKSLDELITKLNKVYKQLADEGYKSFM